MRNPLKTQMRIEQHNQKSIVEKLLILSRRQILPFLKIIAVFIVYTQFFFINDAEGQCVSQGVVNFPFNGNSTTPTITPNSGLSAAFTSTPSTTNGAGNGIATTAVAPPGFPFFTNVAGDARVITGNGFLGGTVSATWTFTFNGGNISNYKTFDVYFQTIRANGANFTMTVAYSKDGGAFQTLTTGTINTTYTAYPISLPAGANNPSTSLVVRMTGSIPAAGFLQSNCQWRVDNFQLRALPDPSAPGTTGTAICSGGAATITATPTGVASVNWYPVATGGTSLGSGNSFNPSNGNPTIPNAYNNAVSGVYTFYAESSLLGCASLRTPTTVTVGVPVTVSPSVSINNICSGSNSALNANIANGSAPYTISWSPATFLNSTTSETPTIINATSTTTYTVNVTDACGNTASGSVTLNVNNLPSIAINPLPANASICGSGNVLLTANGASTYTWSPSTGLSATTGATVSASPISATTYTVTGTSLAGCTGTQSITVNYSLPITANAIANPATVCVNGNSQLQAAAGNTSNYTVAANTLSPVNVTGLTAGSYSTVPSGDDVLSNAVPIGFSFSFYGNTYSTFVVSTNGNIQFGNPPTSIAWTPRTIPHSLVPTPTGNTNGINNYIALAWRDWTTVGSGDIDYYTTGSAPNRVCIIDFNDVGNYVGQIILHESTNTFDIITTSIGTNTSVQGIEDFTGTSGIPVPGRNNVSWSSGAVTSYTYTPSGGTFTFDWSPATFLTSTNISNPIAQNITSTTTYTVTASDANGCSATKSVTLTVDPLSVSCSSLPPGTVCPGSSVNLQSLPAGGSTPYSYAWSNGAITQNTSVTASTSQTYTVTVTDACGNTQSCGVFVSVNPSTTITINSSPSPAVICTSGSVSLAANNANTYIWSPSTGLSATTGSTVTASPLVTTTYTVTGTNGFGCTSTQTIAVNVSPAVNILSTTATPTNPCFNGSSQLDALATNTNSYSVASIPFGFAAPVSPITVSLGNDAMSGAIALPFNFSFYGNNYSQIFIGSNGFIQFGASSGSTGTFGQTLPSATNPNNILAGAWTDLNPSGGGTVTYFTSGIAPNRIFSVNFNNVQIPGIFLGNGSATFQMELFENGNKIEVHLQSINQPAIPNGGQTTLAIKNNNGSLFTAAAGRFNNGNWGATNEAWRFTPSSGSYNYSWSPPTFLSATNISNPVAQNITSTTTYTVTASDANGCSATQSLMVTIDPVSISCSSVPSGSACVGSSVSLQSVASGGSTPYSYVWSTGASTQNTSVTISAPQTYTVTVTDACGNTQSCSLFVDIIQLPSITVNSNPSPAVICTSGSVSLTANGANTYTWAPSFGLSSTVGATVVASPNGTTIYTVTGTSVSGCTNTQTVTVYYSTAITAVASAASSQVCNGGHTQLSASGANNYSIASIPFGFTTPVSPVTVSLANDAISSAVALPFNFNFYGTSYSQIFIGSNGFVQFGSSSGSTGVYGQALPSGVNPDNIVAGVWGDLDPSAAGTVRQWTNGVTPNRTFTVEFNAVKILGVDLFGNPRTSFQIQLKENGVIEVHVQNVVQPNIIANATNTTLAIKNIDGSLFAAPAGRFNSGNWNVSTAEAWRFYPPTAINYTWSPATFLTATNISNPLAQNVTSNITYTVTVADANGCSSTQSVTLSLYQPELAVVTQSSSSVCSGSSVTLNVSDTSSSVFSISSLININDNSIAGPYPSAINVTGIPATATVRSVKLNAVSHTFPDDVDIVLVSPTGQVVTLMSDMGGGTDLVNINYTFKDGFPLMSDASTNPTGTYAPTNDLTADNYSAPGPGSVNVTSTLASFNADPNGIWKLFIVDDAGGDVGTVSGGWSIEFAYNAPFTYSWSPPSGLSNTTNQSVIATPVSNTIYSVLVSDPNSGCNQTLTSEVSLLSTPQPHILEGDSILCSNDLGFDMHVLDGGLYSGGYPAGTLFNFYGAGAILYQTGTSNIFFNQNNSDAFYAEVILPNYLGGCSGLSDTSVIDFGTAQAPQYLLNTDSVACFGDSSGQAIAKITFGGTAGFRWQWFNSSNILVRDVTDTLLADTLSAMPQGMYTIVITDHQGSLNNPYCSVTDSIYIGQPGAQLNVSENITGHVDVLCNGNLTGAIDLSVAGGTAPYSYNWSNGAVTQDISGLSAGIFNCTVTDSRGCVASISITITEPPALSISPLITDVLCNGGTGSILINVTGGLSPYNYIWSNGNSSASNTGIAAGTYTVTVTDANGCTLSGSYTVNEPSILSVNCASTNNSCFNSNNGTVSATVTGGTSPFSYLWSNGAITASQSSLGAGTYTVSVTDENGCTDQCQVTITEPALLTSSYSKTDVFCNGNSTGSADITVNGGTTPYSYNWSNGAVTEDLSGIPAGVYDCTVTDSQGCTIIINITITQPATLSLTPVVTNVLCNGGTGSVLVNVAGGVSPYNYNWSNGNSSASNTGIAAGTYTVTVSDANGCTLSGTYTVNEPAILSVNCASTNNSCFNSNNGTVSVTVSGGTAPYSYSWSNGAVVTATQTSLGTGTYTVTITDANGCSAECTSVITEPPLLSVVVTSLIQPTSASPNSGAIFINITGGVAPYNYVWSNTGASQSITGLSEGTYSVVVTDANGCTATLSATLQIICTLGFTNQVIQLPSCGMNNGIANVIPSGGTQYTYAWQTNPVQTTSTATGLSHNFSNLVIITDVSGCSIADTVTLPTSTGLVLILSSPSYAGGYKIRCNGGNDGSINLSVSGSTGPYTYIWSNGATTQNLTGLSAGTYSVIVSNGGCTNSGLITLTQPPAFTVNTTRTNPSCFGSSNGSATATAGGGVAPYSYSWNTSPVKTSATATGLSGGVYVVTVSDANGCTKTALVTLVQPSVINITGVVTNVNCFGGSNGSINISPSGGTPPYSYLWTGGAITQDRMNVLPPGTYTVTVTDSRGCNMQYSNTVTQPAAALNGVATSTNTTCFGGNNGTGNVTASGGTPPYAYSWNTIPPKSTASVTGLKKGTYTVIITDSHGCLKGVNITITEPPSINISISKINVSTPGGNNGSATANVSGGVAPYSYSWNTVPVKTTKTASGLTAGTYVVTVTDANGCTKTTGVTITQPGPRMYDNTQINDRPATLVYPNPSNGKFTVSFEETDIKDVGVQIYNITGQLVYSNDLKLSKDRTSFEIELKEVPKGLYLIRYISSNKEWIDRIAIE